MSHPLLQDAFVAGEVDRALAGLESALSEEDRRWIRDQLACALEEDPLLAGMLRGAHPRRAMDRSGEMARLDVDEAPEGRAAEGG